MSAAIPLIVIFVLVVLFVIFKAIDQSIAREWFSDYYTKKAFIKHFRMEAVCTHVYTELNQVRFSFSQKGTDYDITVSLSKAKELYDITQSGGIRRTLKSLK